MGMPAETLGGLVNLASYQQNDREQSEQEIPNIYRYHCFRELRDKGVRATFSPPQPFILVR